MRAIDADTMLRLDRIETEAERRFHEARDRNDVEAMRKAAREWTEAAYATTQYALGNVEPYQD